MQFVGNARASVASVMCQTTSQDYLVLILFHVSSIHWSRFNVMNTKLMLRSD